VQQPGGEDPDIEAKRAASAAAAWGGAAPAAAAGEEAAAAMSAAAAPTATASADLSSLSLEELEREMARRKAAQSNGSS
jgi:hypothetical protein